MLGNRCTKEGYRLADQIGKMQNELYSNKMDESYKCLRKEPVREMLGIQHTGLGEQEVGA